jgi:hypothetical protein
VKSIITASYKQSRHEDDLNQPLSVQPWGSDSYKRRYFLIEGLDDTAFRVYRESNPAGLKRTWWSVAGDIEELKQLAEKLGAADNGQRARGLSAKMTAAIPRFEATEEVRYLTHIPERGFPSSEVVASFIELHRLTFHVTETQTTRIPSNSQATIQATRA